MMSLGLEIRHDDALDAMMVARMRLVLALSAMLAVFADAPDAARADKLVWLALSGYMAYSAAVHMCLARGAGFATTSWIHRLDVAWYALMVVCTGGLQSPFFTFFFFAILTSSFRWGFDEGARTTLASTLLFTLCALGTTMAHDLPRLLMRAVFLLALGYMCVYWGGFQLELRRRLALLREVSRVSNPRFGVDHTIVGVLERTRAFFQASSCLLVVQHRETGHFTLRIVRAGEADPPWQPQPMPAEAAAPLLALRDTEVAVYGGLSWHGMLVHEGWAVHDTAQGRWREPDPTAGRRLAQLLEAGSFISAPLPVARATGRIFVVSRRAGLRRSDALFLGQIAAQAFPVIENIQLLDRMASDAASAERRKIALDLHDTAIQPYIGLKLGLAALRKKADRNNPLCAELDSLIAMANGVIDDLRRYAGVVRSHATPSRQALEAALRQQAQRIREFYGIDVAVEMQGSFNVNDRLAVEVLHIVREGLSNILRHTDAQKSAVRLQGSPGRLDIEIRNEVHGTSSGKVDSTARTREETDGAFTPRSIVERAAALGGRAYVKQASAATAVHVEIPL